MQPNQQSIILDTFPPARRGAAFGVAAIATIVAPVLGPTLGGYITDQASWRWIFFLNVPVGIIAVFLVSALVEDPPWVKERKSRGIDFIGLSLITLGLGCLEVMMDRGEDDDWFDSAFIRLMAVLAFLGITRRDLLAAGRAQADRPSRRVQGPQFRHRLRDDRGDGRHSLRQRGDHPAIRAADISTTPRHGRD